MGIIDAIINLLFEVLLTATTVAGYFLIIIGAILAIVIYSTILGG